MEFAGISGNALGGVNGSASGVEQYLCTLPDGLAPVPKEGFGKWAYVEELNRSQQDMLKQREEERKRNGRDAIDFVSASTSAAGGPVRGSGMESRNGTPMSGRSTTSTGRGSGAGSGGERDGGMRRAGSRFDQRERTRRRSRSRSPKRYRHDR